jgi:Tfp pilus assembly protein PilF
MYRGLAISILVLACVGVIGGCASRAQGEIERGRQLLSDNKREEAFAAFDAAVALDPKNADALAGRGCSRLLVDGRAAIADLDRAIELDPKSFDAYRCRAEAHGTAGDRDAALADAQKAVSRPPTTPEPFAEATPATSMARSPTPTRRSPSAEATPSPSGFAA